MATYTELLRDPRWQRKRLETLESSAWSCEDCGTSNSTLHVHHKRYIKGRSPWEYGPDELEVLCETCHTEHHKVSELIKQVLTQIDPVSALALLAGYAEFSQSIEPEITEQAKQLDPLTFAVGFTAGLCDPDIRMLRKVAEFTASLTRENSQARHMFNNSGEVFGS